MKAIEAIRTEGFNVISVTPEYESASQYFGKYALECCDAA
jgi:hypothetical protein